MTRFQIDIEKIVGGETWTNVYHCEAASIASAITLAGQIKDAERPVHQTAVTFVGSRVREVGSGHVGVITLFAQAGTRGPGSGQLLPLFNVSRVDFGNGTNRPARKYLRGVLLNTDVVAGFQTLAAVVTLLNTYADTLLALSGLVDPQGRTLSGRTTFTTIAMHQLRRGNRAKSVLP